MSGQDMEKLVNSTILVCLNRLILMPLVAFFLYQTYSEFSGFRQSVADISRQQAVMQSQIDGMMRTLDRLQASSNGGRQEPVRPTAFEPWARRI